ncbi:hypothetical protein [Streptomyces corynorhini]|uniref:Uncharacterized protein n=1 Tax=Streptomyces corynorhini TaxID=2282652 RepID=A0A370BGZ9_9ACTN|nr:hypothetical protein [Streptomyces corynorhini]RDG38946.1 hypothetical protein DVH02_06235 [Streptomyces corynorhini]
MNPRQALAYQNSATRYLCTGVRLYEDFARRAVDQARYERIRSRAPSYGVDLDEVRAHAEASLRDLRVRDRWVSAAFVLSLLVAPVATVMYTLFSAALSAGSGMATSAGTAGIPAAGLRRTAAGRRRGERAGPAPVAKPRDSRFVALARPLVTHVMVLILACWLGRMFLWSPPGVLRYVVAAALLICCPWYCVWKQRDAAWTAVREQLRPGVQRATKGSGDDANLIVYSGYSPFVGAGAPFTSWSFANRLVPRDWKPGSGEQPPAVPFGSSELVERLRADLTELGSRSPVSADGIAGLKVAEKVFVHGTALFDTSRIPRSELWPGSGSPGRKRPADRLPEERITAARGLVDGPVRHCLSVQIRSWDTDLILTVFVQVSVDAGTLYLQSDSRVLAPVQEEFRVADSLQAAESEEEATRRAAESVLATGGVLLASVPNVLSELGAAGRLERWEEEQRWAIERDKRYDFGARASLREEAASPNYRNFFQFVDVTRTGKQVELRVLGAVLNFLAEHGLDISDLDARRTTILNNGVMMYGGSVTGSIAAGAGATASATTTGRGPGPAGSDAGKGTD